MIRIPFGAALGLSLATPGRRTSADAPTSHRNLVDQGRRPEGLPAGAARPHAKRTEH